MEDPSTLVSPASCLSSPRPVPTSAVLVVLTGHHGGLEGGGVASSQEAAALWAGGVNGRHDRECRCGFEHRIDCCLFRLDSADEAQTEEKESTGEPTSEPTSEPTKPVKRKSVAEKTGKPAKKKKKQQVR